MLLIVLKVIRKICTVYFCIKILQQVINALKIDLVKIDSINLFLFTLTYYIHLYTYMLYNYVHIGV